MQMNIEGGMIIIIIIMVIIVTIFFYYYDHHYLSPMLVLSASLFECLWREHGCRCSHSLYWFSLCTPFILPSGRI